MANDVNLIRRLIFVILALALLPHPGGACDPEHDWEAVRSFSRRTLGFQGVAGILLQSSAGAEAKGAPFRKGARIAIVDCEDAYGRAGCLTSKADQTRPSTAQEKAALLAIFEKTLAFLLERDYGVQVVRLAKVRALEKRLGADSAMTPRLFDALAKEHGTTHFLAVTLTKYAQTVRLHRDTKPKNKGLYLAQSFSMAHARVTLRKKDGLFVVADDFSGHGANSVIYFGVNDEPAPVRKLIQVRAGRPGVIPGNWQLYADRDHFESSPAAMGPR